MLHRMSAHLSLAGSTVADSWPMARVMAGMSAMPVAHAIDLAFLFPAAQPHHDALIAETRRHLGGCLTAIETALRVALDQFPEIAGILALSPDPLCWRMICDQPALLSPALLAHMRLRGGVSLMLRQLGQRDADIGEPVEADGQAVDPAPGDALAALALAESRWMTRGGEDWPMRPDVAREFFTEMVWTSSACLAEVVRRAAPDRADVMLAAFERAGWAVLADHDESVSPLMEAERLVRRMEERADAPDLLGAALGGRRFLLFAALAARRLRLTMIQVVDILVMAPLPQLAALCRSLGGSDGDYRHLLLTLRPVRPWLTDTMVIVEAERYQELDEAQADAMVAALRTPASFRAKLDHLLSVRAA